MFPSRLIHSLGIVVLSVAATPDVRATTPPILNSPPILPQQPRAFEPITVQIPGGARNATRGCLTDPIHVVMEANVISVRFDPSIECRLDFPTPPPRAPLSVQIGSFPAGDYQVEVFSGEGTLMMEASFTVAPFEPEIGSDIWPAPMNGFSFTDAWFDPEEPGSGLLLYAPATGVVFGVLMTYDNAGRPDWYLLGEGEWAGCNSYKSALFRTTGTSILAPYDREAQTQEVVGEITLTWRGSEVAGHCQSAGAWDGLNLAIAVDDDAVEKSFSRAFHPRR